MASSPTEDTPPEQHHHNHKPRIYYFNTCGRAEFIKIILEYVGQPYEFLSPDLRQLTSEGRLAFDQFPLYEDTDGFELVQSGTIIRYIAKKYGIYPTDEKHAGIAEMVADGVMDFLGAYFRAFIYVGDEGSRETYKKHSLPKWLTFFNRILSKYKRGTTFLFGDEVTFADLLLFQSFVVAEESVPGTIHKFPIIEKFYNQVLTFRKVADFLKSDRHIKAISMYPRPILPLTIRLNETIYTIIHLFNNNIDCGA